MGKLLSVLETPSVVTVGLELQMSLYDYGKYEEWGLSISETLNSNHSEDYFFFTNLDVSCSCKIQDAASHKAILSAY